MGGPEYGIETKCVSLGMLKMPFKQFAEHVQGTQNPEENIWVYWGSGNDIINI